MKYVISVVVMSLSCLAFVGWIMITHRPDNIRFQLHQQQVGNIQALVDLQRSQIETMVYMISYFEAKHDSLRKVIVERSKRRGKR